ncbi:Pol [Symbiodinium sp. CCMP2592]|nr:Pol [Symbiodinium sp. CCMP2592]
MVCLEPIWVMQQEVGSLVLSIKDGAGVALPSGCPVSLEDEDLRRGRGLVFLAGAGLSFRSGPAVSLLANSKKFSLVPRQARDLQLIRMIGSTAWLPTLFPPDASDMSEVVPKIVLKACLSTMCGVGFLQGQPVHKAEALALHLAQTSPMAGLVVVDVSPETCAQVTMQGCDPVEPKTLLACSLRACHLVQCPALMLTGPVQAQQWCREGLAIFQVATGFHCAEIQLSQEGGLSDWWCVLTAPELGRVPVEQALAFLEEERSCDAVGALKTWHFGIIWRVWKCFLQGRSQAKVANSAHPAEAPSASPTHSAAGASLGVLGFSGPPLGSLKQGFSTVEPSMAARECSLRLGDDVMPLADTPVVKRPRVCAPASFWHVPVGAEGHLSVLDLALQGPCKDVRPPESGSLSEAVFLLFAVQENLQVLALSDFVMPGQQVHLVAFGPRPADSVSGLPPFSVPSVPLHLISSAERLLVLRWQAHWMASDQASHALACIADRSPWPVRVLDPLDLGRCCQTPNSSCLGSAFVDFFSGGAVVSALAVEGHWVSFCWQLGSGVASSWASLPMTEHKGPLVDAVATANMLVARALGLSVAAFKFLGGPHRPHAPGFCGHFAMADLSVHLDGEPPLDAVAALGRASLWAESFVEETQQSGQVPPPCMVAGVVPPLLEHGLSAALREKGVPEAVLADRVKDAIQRVGRGPLQKALQAPHQWRELKAVCSNASPPFQLVLPSELQGFIDTKLANGEELGPRRKSKGKVPKAQATAPVLQLPSPESVTVAPGVFEQEGTALSQIQLPEIGPQAQGVVVVSASAAGPYLRIDKPVSKQALGLLVLGSLNLSGTSLKSEVVRFQASCSTTQEPVLLTATLLQIGDRFVQKVAPGQRMTLDLVPSAILRLAVYRDQWEGSWAVFAQKPLRSVLEACSCIRTCSQVGCSCSCWHGSSSPGVPEALLEVWGRGFVTTSFKPCAPEEAEVFNALLRVPAALLPVLLACSGDAGVYFEPRGKEPRDPSSEYSVFWLPKADFHEALVCKQTHADVLGVARVARRFGVRCEKAKAEALHKILRPAVPFMCKDGALTFHAGPWPFGTQRSTLTKAFQDWGWEAKPLQPIPRPSGNGLWWAIQALKPPPQAVLHIQEGEVLISEVKSKVEGKTPSAPTVVASKAALQAINNRATSSTDPLQSNDPWAAALGARSAKLPQAQAPPIDVQAMSKQIEANLRTQIASQVEAASSALTGRVAALETTVSDVVVQVKDQETRLKGAFQELFEQQTQRIEALLAKRQRQEHAAALAAFRSFRFGEAAHPGPVNSAGPEASDSQFVIGAVNPTGLNGKHGVLSDLPRGLFAISETHLSARGVELFRSGLHFAKSHFRYVAGPPAPARARSHVTGDYTGVGFLSSFAGRGAPHSFEPSLFSSARLQVASFLVGSTWILGAVVYGLPAAPKATEVLLEAITQRVVLQGTGPRFLAGDFNLEPHALHHASVWADNGFAEVQDLWHQRTGSLPQVTCKNSTRKDYVWISAELQPLLQRVEVDPTWFCDHSLLSATFTAEGLQQPLPLWRMPRQRVIPAQVARLMQDSSCTPLPASSDEAYRAIWNRYEDAASEAFVACGQPPLRASERGRATTRDVHVASLFQAVVPKGRHGEVTPTFFGPDRQYVQWFRQLRRVQALCQALRKTTPSDAACEYRAGLWHAILKAPGFKPSFRQWWPTREVIASADPLCLGTALPDRALAEAIFASLQANVQKLERRLKNSRQKAAKQRRVDNPSLVFKDLRGPPAKPVETVVDKVSAVVSQVFPEESAVAFAEPVRWRPQAGFFVEDSPLTVFHAEEDKLWGEVSRVTVGQVISQQQTIADLPGLFAAFGAEWSKRWMRHEHIDADCWQQVLETLPALSSASLGLQALTPPVWRAAVKAKHAHSATGPDGVSRADLLALPDACTQGLLDLCGRAECTGDWPAQVLDARVSALEKVPDAATVTQYRPICVLSVTYRTWSSLRAKEALRHLASIAPPTLFGNMPGRSAGCVWYQMQLAIEQAHMEDQPLVGVLLDLSKAFNTLPRPPVFALALKLGLPRELVVAWSSAVAKLARRFQIRGATGPALPSYTGFPEGCALSCVAMMLVDFALHRHVDASAGAGSLTTFVDDWQLMNRGVPQVQVALQAVSEFVRGWDLAMDPAKSVHWATRAEDRRLLRRSGVSVAHSARNLGGNMVFTRARRLSTISDRIASLQDLWPRLAVSPSPLKQKLLALTASAWPKALHGVSATSLSDDTFATLRAGASRGLGFDRPGLSSKVLLSFCCFPLADPQFFAIAATFRDLRAFAEPTSFVPVVEHLLSLSKWPPGPAQAFLERCHALGWAWCPDGHCLRDAISTFDPWQVSPQELMHRLVYAWQFRVGSELESRSGFSGMSRVDAALTNRLLKGWKDEDRLNVMLAQAGAFFTQDALHHFSQDPADSLHCRFCRQPDSVQHRLWYCSAFEDCRAQCSAFELPDPATDLPVQFLRGWALRPAKQLELWQALAAIDDRSGQFDLPASLPARLDVFTDGSCLLPTVPQLRLASWSVVLAADSTVRPWVLAAGALPGIVQTAFRAEIFAVLSALKLALQTGRAVRIWSDCAGVVRKLTRMGSGLISLRPSMLNFDLWQQVADVLARLTVPWTVHKVAAHVDADASLSAVDDWLIHNNAAADAAADKANAQRSDFFWALWNDVRRDFTLQELKATAALRHQRLVAAKATAGKDTLWEDKAVGAATAVPVIHALSEPLPRALLKFGDPFVLAISQWLVGLTELPQHAVQWYSFAQLYLAFCFETHIVPPVWDAGTRRWVHVSDEEPRLAGISFAIRARYFRQQVRAVVSHGRGRLLTAEARPYSVALAIKLPVCSIGLRSDCYEQVERFLFQALPKGVCAQNERTWTRVPIPRIG